MLCNLCVYILYIKNVKFLYVCYGIYTILLMYNIAKAKKTQQHTRHLILHLCICCSTGKTMEAWYISMIRTLYIFIYKTSAILLKWEMFILKFFQLLCVRGREFPPTCYSSIAHLLLPLIRFWPLLPSLIGQSFVDSAPQHDIHL